MFTKFSQAVHARFVELSKGELYVVDIPDIFDKYLAAFPEVTFNHERAVRVRTGVL